MTLIRDISNILEYGRKTTSYKFVALLGIFDYIAEHATEAPINNLHFIPLAYLAKQFVSHYYPISMYDFPQGSLAEDKDVKVKTYIQDIHGEIIRFFSLINSGTPFNSEYELHRKDGMRAKKPISKNWIEILRYDPTNIVIEDLTYQELSRYRFWARAVILKAWFDFIVRLLEKMTNNQHSDSNLTVFHNLIGYAYLNEESRDQTLINHYRDFYTQIKGINNTKV